MPALGGRTARAAARAKERTAYLARDVLVRSTKAWARRQERILKSHPHMFFGIDKDLFELAMVKDTPFAVLLAAARRCIKTTIPNLPCEHPDEEAHGCDKMHGNYDPERSRAAQCGWYPLQQAERVHPCLARWTRPDGRVLLKIWIYALYRTPNFVCDPCWDADGAVWVTPAAVSNIPGKLERAAIRAFAALADKNVAANADVGGAGAGSGAAGRGVH